MDKTIYLECFSGISGDMTVAALLDLGADKDVLINSLDSLNLTGYEIKISYVNKNGINACDFSVILDEKHENYDHNMEYLHGNKDVHIHNHSHEHRKLTEIINIINKSAISDNAKNISLKIFDILAESESKAHNVPKEQVIFHEVGAVDSIVDIVAVAVCIDNLQITDVIVPVLYEGKGFVRCRHGVLPVPVPAVLNIATKHSIKLNITDYQGEFVTPTGAAIVAALSTSSKLPQNFVIKKVGMGAGKRNYDKPSLLRAMLIEEDKKDEIYKLETNIDDCSGEIMGYVMNKILKIGAKDIYFTPIYMKKNRPAYELGVLCEYKDIDKIEEFIFKYTTTIGIRKYKVERTVLNREIIDISTKYGMVKVKKCILKNEMRYYPEYDSISKICDTFDIPYQQVYSDIVEICESME